ncbi:MAG: glycosyltransferase [Candidatus Nitrotoga sp.]
MKAIRLALALGSWRQEASQIVKKVLMISDLSPDFTDLPGRRTVPRNYMRSTVACEYIDVSIITPYYNTEEFFVETFVSLQAQSLQNWEWVIVDDGSTDQESVNRLAKIAANDERIKVIRQTNAGPGAARNTAFRNASGRYICLLDSDDMVEPTYLEKAVWFLDSNPEFAFCNSYSVIFGEQEYLWTTGFERGKAHLQANSGPPISVIRRSAYADCGGFDESIRFGHEDWDFWLAMAKAGHWGYTIPEFLQWYRKRGNGRFEQIMRSGNVNAEFERMMHRKYDGLDKHFPEPVRRHPLPYETIEMNSLVCNPLAANPLRHRIMFIIPWMVTGGADRVNLDLIEGLTSKGHDITICATLPADHGWEHQFRRFTPDIFVLPKILHASDYPRFLAYLIQSRQIDTVVITGSTIGYQLLPYLRAVSASVAFVDMCHVEELHWLNGGHPRFGVGYQDMLDLNIVTTKHLAEWMQGRGADSTRIRVMYTGVRATQENRLVEFRNQIRSELNIPADVPVIVFAGRICEQKRPALLAEILKAAHDHGLLFRALIIGDGEQRDQLEGLLSQYQLNANVQMLGSVSHQRWLDVLVASDILLMPSQYEGISIALLEAMAAGAVPVVAKVGGQEEIVSPNAGILIPHGINEPQEYLDAIRRLLSNSAELHQMSKQCKFLAASKLSWEGMVDNFLVLLDEAHQLRVDHPRYPISPSFGRELASLSLEYKRLGEAVDWLWNAKPHSALADAMLQTTSAEAQAVVKFAILLSQTWPGRMIIRSRFLKTIVKRLLKRMANRSVA